MSIDFVNKSRDFIASVFDSVASKYDLANDAMSLGTHRIWKRTFSQIISVYPGDAYLDLSCGTGDIALRIIKNNPNLGHITLADPDVSMLSLAKSKLLDSGILAKNIQFLQTTAEDLSLPNSQDVITLSFGARNFSNLKLGLENCCHALKAGGRFYCMEFSPTSDSRLLQKIYNRYLDHALPRIGKIITGNQEAYQYLADSIKNFLKPHEMQDLIRSIGFKKLDHIPLFNGIVSIYIARKE